MKRLFDFSCPECHFVTEKLVDTHIHSISCECGGKAARIISMPTVKLDGTDPSFPGAYDHWANIREDHARIKKKKSWAEP
jgi:hypothetical protein